MTLTQQSCEEFVTQLASNAPVPGGGSASALVGAIGTALGAMVGSLTLGKKKYAAVQESILSLNQTALALCADLTELVSLDAIAFAPLARAYSLPTNTPEQRVEKSHVMEDALQDAAAVPLRIMEKCGAAIVLHRDYAAQGSAIAISDVGVGVACCKAALQGASLNVLINTRVMTDRVKAEAINLRANELLTTYTCLADEIFADVAARLN
ncbi:MAG: cyclodeaminase/cyclohydrolase family protein [Oscillospiraceae bacterium]